MVCLSPWFQVAPFVTQCFVLLSRSRNAKLKKFLDVSVRFVIMFLLLFVAVVVAVVAVLVFSVNRFVLDSKGVVL